MNEQQKQTDQSSGQNQRTIGSPNNQTYINVGIDDSQIWYSFYLENGRGIISKSKLAIYDSENNLATVSGEVEFTENSFNETWEQPWGEQHYVENSYRELAIQTNSFTVRFRVYDEGFGFRYEINGEGETTIANEETEFNLPLDSTAWWIPALGQNHYEHLYKKTLLSDIDTAHTPLTAELTNGGYIAIHEAALYDYGSMNLIPTEKGLTSTITPLVDGGVAKVSLPFKSPWRTVIFAERAVDLGHSKIMLNLNEPSKIDDTSWINPTKFMGIWWGMFVGYYTWGSGKNHGATTRNALRYINAAKQLGISALLIEGWNETWDGDWTKNGSIMNHLQPYPDFDIHTVTSYAKAQGVEIVGHHETAGNISHYEWQLPEAYDYYRHLGVKYVKTGYVSPRLNTGDFHSSQVGVKHYQKTVELAAERKMMLDIHEPVKGTGIERTWPNLMTREGVMGQEYEGGAITPEHVTVLPYTRQLAGPLDYTPGLFNLTGTRRKIHSTLGKQLALYVTMYSPMQMVADLPYHYEGHPAFKFIQDVPVNWESTLPLDGVIGDFYTVARKDRHSDAWYIGGVTDENERTVSIHLDFLNEHQTYHATIYRDGDDADWHNNPEAYSIDTQQVTSQDTLSIRMAPGGGFAIAIKLDGVNEYPYPEM